MTVKLPQKAGFVPTTAEWDQLVRIAENLAVQLAQARAECDAAQASAVETARIVGAERDAARAEVARLRAARIHLAELWRDFLNNRDSIPAGLALRDETIRVLAAALRQPAPAQGQE